MKILVVSHEYPPLGGGGANACMNLTEKYVELGHEVTVLTAWYMGLQCEEVVNGVKIIRLRAKRSHVEHCGFGEMLDYLGKALKIVGRLEKKEKFDICQVFFAIPSGPVGYYLKKRFHVPYIIRFGGGDIPGFQERFKFVYKLIGPAEIILWKNASALVANSKGLKAFAEMFYAKKPIEIIPNGVNLEIFPVKSRATTEKCFRLLFVSRLLERKGLQCIIPQLSEIRNKLKCQLELTIVGDGPYREELIRLVKRHGVENIVKFTGQKEKKDLPVYYMEADLFIFPSRKEGMPNVVLEAMASGLPIVMTCCEGSEELIDGNGYAVPVESFSQKIEELYYDEELRKQMGQRSRELVEERFQWSSVAASYAVLFEKAVLNEMEKRK